MFITIEEGLNEAERIGKREEVLVLAKELQAQSRIPISLLECIEQAYIQINR